MTCAYVSVERATETGESEEGLGGRERGEHRQLEVTTLKFAPFSITARTIRRKWVSGKICPTSCAQTRHAVKLEHEGGEQDRRQKEKEGELVKQQPRRAKELRPTGDDTSRR